MEEPETADDYKGDNVLRTQQDSCTYEITLIVTVGTRPVEVHAGPNPSTERRRQHQVTAV